MVPRENNPKKKQKPTPKQPTDPRCRRTQIKTPTNREKGVFSVCLGGMGNVFSVTVDIHGNMY